MNRLWKGRFRWGRLLLVWLVFLLLAGALFAERSGVQYTAAHVQIGALDHALTKEEALAGQAPVCLLLCDSRQVSVAEAKEQLEQILQDMKVPAEAADLADTAPEALPAFENYETIVVLVPNFEPLGLRLLDLMDWVEQGGNVLFAMTPEKCGAFDVVAQKLGVLASAWNCKTAESIVPAEGFLLGGGQRYELSDPFESSMAVQLRDDAAVYAVTGDEGVPLIWSAELGKGRVVVDNIGVYDKVMRGFYAASYSLLGEACAYPVLNSAVFFLDDFPSPVPEGDGQYIRQDYGLSIADFYAKVWWPDLVQLAERFVIRYTGVMIENYEDDTTDPPLRQSDTQPFRYFGGLLLRQGGEVGFHGYNHQPLVLPQTDYAGLYDYNPWPSADAIVAAGGPALCRRFGVCAAVQHPVGLRAGDLRPAGAAGAHHRQLLPRRRHRPALCAGIWRGSGRHRGRTAHRVRRHGERALYAAGRAERAELPLRQHPLHAPG